MVSGSTSWRGRASRWTGEARSVEIHGIRITRIEIPELTLDVECGKGVYMRSLAHDLGEALGCGAHVTDLERRSCAGFNSEDGVTLEQLEEDSRVPDGWRKHLHPVDWVVRDLKTVTVGQAAEKFLRNGQSVSLGRPEVNAGYLEAVPGLQLVRAIPCAGEI